MPTMALLKPDTIAARNFAKCFLALARSLTAEVGLDFKASADDHPRHEEYVALIERAWQEARELQLPALKKVGGRER
jgi:hypothetical protein